MTDASVTSTKAEKRTQIIGWVASLMCIAMYFSYIDQIHLNLTGHQGSFVLPLITTLNCTLWSAYALSKKPIDLPILVCNIPGICLGIITAVTAMMPLH